MDGGGAAEGEEKPQGPMPMDIFEKNKKAKRPYNWILIHNAEKHSSVILEVNHNKDNVEIVNWHYLKESALEQKERQAIKEGGLILTLESAVGNTQNDLSSDGKGMEKVPHEQPLDVKSDKNVEVLKPAPTKEQKIIAEQLVEPIKKSGIEVSTDVEEMNRVLKEAGYEPLQKMTVWHGSSSGFANFDHSHMGEGEGAQVHGWGTYVAVDKEVGKKYAERFGGMKPPTWKGEEISGLITNGYADPVREAYDSLVQEGSIEKAIDFTERILKLPFAIADEKAKAYYNKVLSILKESKESDFKGGEKNLYEVEIPDNDGVVYLGEWKEPTDKQKQMIMDQAKKEGVAIRNVNADVQLMRKALTEELGSEKAVSEFFNRAGFVGISYKGRIDGICYVIFNDKDLKIKNRVQFLKTPNGEVYGFVKDGKMYLDTTLLNPNTTVHEYTHLWGNALMKANPELWKQGKELMKQTPVWDEVMNDPNYADIRNNEDLVASEVHSRLTGEKADEIFNKMIEEARKNGSLIDVTQAVTLVDKLKKWIQDVFMYVRDTFSPWTKEQAQNVSLEDFLKMPLRDLLNGKPIGKTVVDGYDVVVKNEGNNSKNILFHVADSKEVNKHFNHELTRYQNGEMDKNEMLHLGRPQGVMRAFLPNLPIVMRQRILTKGSVRKHNVAIEALANMPNHLSHPIFVFKRGDNAFGVLTEMQDRDGKNVCVAIELNRQIQNGGEILEVNDIRSVHGRNVADIVYPIVQNGTLKWVDKGKGLAYLSSASRYVQQEIDKQILSSATKIVKDFVNPKVLDEKVVNRDNDEVKFRILDTDDPKAKELESLPDSELVPVYRNVQVFEDDALGSPMAFSDAETGERRVLQGQMPMDKDGEPDFASVTPERAHSFLYGESGLTHAETNEFVESKYYQSKRELEKADESGNHYLPMGDLWRDVWPTYGRRRRGAWRTQARDFLRNRIPAY